MRGSCASGGSCGSGVSGVEVHVAQVLLPSEVLAAYDYAAVWGAEQEVLDVWSERCESRRAVARRALAEALRVLRGSDRLGRARFLAAVRAAKPLEGAVCRGLEALCEEGPAPGDERGPEEDEDAAPQAALAFVAAVGDLAYPERLLLELLQPAATALRRTCPVCLDSFLDGPGVGDVAFFLPCLHSVCRGCCAQLPAVQRCPCCRGAVGRLATREEALAALRRGFCEPARASSKAAALSDLLEEPSSALVLVRDEATAQAIRAASPAFRSATFSGALQGGDGSEALREASTLALWSAPTHEELRELARALEAQRAIAKKVWLLCYEGTRELRVAQRTRRCLEALDASRGGPAVQTGKRAHDEAFAPSAALSL